MWQHTSGSLSLLLTSMLHQLVPLHFSVVILPSKHVKINVHQIPLTELNIFVLKISPQ